MAPGRPFKKGKPKTGGRKKGVTNKVTQEKRDIAREIVEDPNYMNILKQRVLSGEVHPAIESMLWHYAKGKPVNRHEITGSLSLTEILSGEADKDE